MTTVTGSPTRRRWGLRTYIVGLLLIFVATAGAAAVFQRAAAADDARRAAVQDAAFAARVAARDIAADVGIAQQAVATTAANPTIGRVFAASPDCTLTFGAVGAFRSGHLDIVARDGRVACSSLRTDGTPSYAAADWLGGVLGAPAFLGPVPDARTGKLVVLASAPIGDQGAVVAFLDLDSLGPGLAQKLAGPRRLEFVVTTPDRRVALARSVDAARWVGASLADTSFARTPDGAAHRDLDGASRLYGQATVEGLGWHVFAGADRSDALAAVERLTRRELGIILAGLLVFLVAVLVVSRRIARPIDRLSVAVRAAAVDKATAPVGVTGPAEVAALIEDFNVLVERANREAAIVASSSDAIVSMTPDGVMTSWNAGAERMLGYTADEVIGRNTTAFASGEAASLRRAFLDRVAAGEHIKDFEVRLPHKDGHVIDASVSASPIRDATGEVVAVALVTRDITERNRAAAERHSLEERLHQVERLESVGQLAGGIAHDFNNLLAVIMSYAGFVAERTHDAEVRADVEQIRNAAERAAGLTRQLLIFGRQEPANAEVLDLNAVVADIQQLLSRSIGEHVEQVARLAERLPPIRADRSRVEQVLVNLAVNARDAMPDGGVLTIETKVTELDADYARTHPGIEPGRYVELAVTDTGTGMSREMAARIFEPFFTTKPTGQGTGLGLATVYGIVTEAGGAVNVYSEPGIGTSFRVYLPAVDAAVSAAPQRDSSDLPQGSGRTVLVVEDEPAMLEVTARMLRRNGYVVLEAGAYDVALSLAAENDFDLLLSDSIMPQMAGREVAERVRELRPGKPVLFMSGYGGGAVGGHGTVDDGAPLLQKPFNERTLLEAVRAALGDPT